MDTGDRGVGDVEREGERNDRKKDSGEIMRERCRGQGRKRWRGGVNRCKEVRERQGRVKNKIERENRKE